MAIVPGFYRGEPADIPDNFAVLWPEEYTLAPPSAAVENEKAVEAKNEEPVRAQKRGK